MRKAKNIRTFFLRKVTLVFSVKVILSLVVLVNAASITATTTSYQAVIGGAISVASSLSGADKGFSKASTAIAATTNCPAGTVFGVGTTATPGVTSGDLVYDLQVNFTGTPINTCWQVTFVYTSSGGSQTTLGPVGIASVTSSGTIDCKFDIGASAPNSPFSYKVSVA